MKQLATLRTTALQLPENAICSGALQQPLWICFTEAFILKGFLHFQPKNPVVGLKETGVASSLPENDKNLSVVRPPLQLTIDNRP